MVIVPNAPETAQSNAVAASPARWAAPWGHAPCSLLVSAPPGGGGSFTVNDMHCCHVCMSPYMRHSCVEGQVRNE